MKPSKPAPRLVLKKLLNRIRSQRNDLTEPSHTSAAGPGAILTDEIPERDTSIDTGSLASVEKIKPIPRMLGKSVCFHFLFLFEPAPTEGNGEEGRGQTFSVYRFRYLLSRKRGFQFC